jgi:CO/xanthine dehydrogenase FAD-binding subunit
MDFLQPGSLTEALEMKAEHPQAVVLAGGTDLMVDLNFDRKRPEVILDVTRVPELTEWSRSDGSVRLGAGVTYARLISEVASLLPGLAIASRTVGSPQIRNRGTVGGNLGTASPAGDALPPLLAGGAEVEVASVLNSRTVALGDFVTGPKQNSLTGDELIVAVTTPVARGPQQFSKIGTRNAMVIAVAAFALSLDPVQQRVGTGIGSAGPKPLPAIEAETFLAGVLESRGLWQSRAALDESELARFGELVARAAQPIDDVRGTAAYRRHALGIMASRTLSWAWDEYTRDA